MTEADKIKAFLTDDSRKGIIKLTTFERKNGVPQGTLKRFLRGETLPENQIPRIINGLKAFGYEEKN